MEKLPMEWIDKLFDCMTQFYGERWEKMYDRFMPKELAKPVWQSALIGCTYDEIKHALVLLKQASEDPNTQPPIHMEFWRYAKKKSTPSFRPKEANIQRGDPEIAKKAIADMRAKLHQRSPLMK